MPFSLKSSEEKLFPLLTPRERMLQGLLMGLLILALTLSLNWLATAMALSSPYRTLIILFTALLIGACAIGKLEGFYGRKHEKAFLTRTDRLIQYKKPPYLPQILYIGLGWGLSMWLIFLGYLFMEYGWQMEYFTYHLPVWIGAGLLYGILSAFLPSK